MFTSNGCARERRWVVFSTDSRHVTLGWHSEPTEGILVAERDLAPWKRVSWLAVVETDC